MDKEQIVLNEFKPEEIPLSCTWICIGPPGSGKCLARGTPVMMANHEPKPVELIQTGEKLLGDDGKPRKVLSTTSGFDNMYKITQSNGMTYVANEPHILCLRNSIGEVLEITVLELLKKPELFQSYKGYKLGDNNDSDITIEFVGVGEYFGFQIDGNGRFALGDYTITHNTTFIENMCYHLKHRYPVCRSFLGTLGAYNKFCDITHSLYCSPYYSEQEEEQHILRQKTCELENGKGYPGNYAVNVIDDASDDPKVYKTKTMRGLFKLGSQHWSQLLLIGTQYAIDMPPDIRKSVSYVAIFFEPEEQERKKLYNNFGGLAGSYDRFCDLMDQVCHDHTCLIFKKRTQSNQITDNIFWYKTTVLPAKWNFGCKEYHEWAENRYNKDYVDSAM